MANKGLFYYKLKSTYPEDITRDCKLSIVDIDSNFKTLKDDDIKDINFDDESKELTLYRNDGEQLSCSLEKLIPEQEEKEYRLNVDYDTYDGIIDIDFNGEQYSIRGLLTKENIDKNILRKVYSDGTLVGIGTSKMPLGVAPVHRTGFYRPVKRLINLVENERIPNKNIAKGDRFVVYEKISDYGLLYNFKDVCHLNDILSESGWRVPSKSDWDNMLNAIEPCEYRDHSSTLNNRVLGKMAGSLLKSVDDWCNQDCCIQVDDFDIEEQDDSFDVDFQSCGERRHPHHKPFPKPISTVGQDSYGMSILPAGYAYMSRPPQFINFGKQGAFWTTDTLYDSDVYAKVFTDKDSGVLQIGERPTAYLSVRLVKDYDGSNYHDIETIKGQTYKTVLMPSLNTPSGLSIWTAQNISIECKDIHALQPREGFKLKERFGYYIYEWNGFDWDKIELVEGDAITVLEGKRPNEVYRVVNNRLENADDIVINIVENDFKNDVVEIKSRLDCVENAINGHAEKLVEIDNEFEENAVEHNKFKESIESLKDKDTELENSINTLDEKVTTEVEKLDDVIKKEREDRIQQDGVVLEFTTSNIEALEKSIDSVKTKLGEETSRLDERIDAVSNKVDDNVNTINDKIDAEVSRLDKAIADEATLRDKNDDFIFKHCLSEFDRVDSELKTESEERKKSDDELRNTLDEETKTRKDKDAELENSINTLDEKVTTEVEKLDDVINTLDEKVTTEVEKLDDVIKTLDEKVEDEINNKNQRLEDLESRVIRRKKCEYDVETGVLTLPTVDETKTIKVQFSSDYGTWNFKEGILRK